MGSATAHLVGNVATEPKKSLENEGRERVSFRVIANDRYKDSVSNAWVDGDSYAVNVVCWGALAKGVAQSVKLGDPVIVWGRLIERRYQADNETKFTTEVKATQVSHDLSRGRATFQRLSQANSVPDPAQTPEPANAGLEELMDAPF